jgi:hypothetical protein
MVKLSPLGHGAGGHGGDRVRVDGAAPRGRADKGGGAVADPTLAIETIARMGHPQFRNGSRVGHPALVPTERYAQQQEKIFNLELRKN